MVVFLLIPSLTLYRTPPKIPLPPPLPRTPPPPLQIFCVVCLTVGVCAWQSLICICAVLTDEPGMAYSLSFLALGCGRYVLT